MGNVSFAAQSVGLLIASGALSLGIYLLVTKVNGAVDAQNNRPLVAKFAMWFAIALVTVSLSVLLGEVVVRPSPDADVPSAPHGNLSSLLTFLVLAGTCMGSSILVIVSCRLPSILLGFVLVLLSNSGLLLLAGAGFVAAANVIVLAGGLGTAWLLTSQQSASRILKDIGLTRSQRPIHEPFISCLTAGLLVFVLAAATQFSFTVTRSDDNERRAETNLPDAADFGLTLFRDHFLSIEIAGLLMLVTIVGATLIVLNVDRRPKV